MSGGSFDYICAHDIDELMDSHTQREQMERMRDALRQYEGGESAALLTDRLLKEFEEMDRKKNDLRRLRDSLEDVWQAVEWHQSRDWGPDAVKRAIDAFNESLVAGLYTPVINK